MANPAEESRPGAIDILNDVIYGVVEDLREIDEEAAGLEIRSDCVLQGDGAVIQSMMLVNLILKVQTRVEEVIGVSIELASEKALSRRNSPYRTLGTLADYVQDLLDEKRNGSR